MISPHTKFSVLLQINRMSRPYTPNGYFCALLSCSDHLTPAWESVQNEHIENGALSVAAVQ